MTRMTARHFSVVRVPVSHQYNSNTLSPGSTLPEPPGTPLSSNVLANSDNIDRDRVEAQALEQVLCLLVDVELAALAVLGKVEGGHFGHVLILAFTLFFLQLEGDTADGTTLDALHQMGGVTGDLEEICVSRVRF